MFDNNVSVLIPYKAVDEYREKNWSWIKRRYEIIMPNAEICMGDYSGEPFCKSVAVNNAAKKATRDIFIIADADIVFNIDQIKNAIEALSFHPWVIPYRSFFRLNPDETDEMWKKSPDIILNEADFQECHKHGISNRYELVGGINVLPRKYFEKVGGFDERFKGWGGEDDAFQMAVDTLCGHYYRIETAMWHLYHPKGSKEHSSNNCRILDEFYCNKETISQNLNNKLN